MAKHRRFSDTPEPDSVQKDEEIELVEQEIPSKETSTNIKSILLSGTKYVYIIAAVALLSGIFTPLTIGAEFETVAFGMLSVFLGLGGGITIFLGVKNQKFTTLMICGGLGMMIASLVLIYELADRPLF
ncbi:hypothetical protein N9385_02325 [Candidatus Nitrosopelagicus sp.]|nr:hypothetical protein [Candidatus Nitrosopelagicus sp.]